MRLLKEQKHFFIQPFLWFLAFMILRSMMNLSYLFEWIVHNKTLYIGLGVFAFLLSVVNKQAGYNITIGNFFGIFFGHYLGDLLQEQSMRKITEDMDEQVRYGLSKHSGVFIWILCILLSLILTIIIGMIKNKGRRARCIAKKNGDH